MTAVLCVPQWQGSMANVAPRLVAGAHHVAAVAAGLGRVGAVATVPVTQSDSDTVDGVHALDVLVDNQRRVEEALSTITGPVLTVGGDCSVDIAPIIAARDRHGDALTVLWIDTHPRLHRPTTHPVAAFHGMTVRTLLGDGPAGLTPKRPLLPHQVVIVGELAGDRLEHDYLSTSGLRRHSLDRLDIGNLTGPVYVHLDWNVLAGDSEPDGVTPRDIVKLLSRLPAVVSASVTEYAPSPGDPNSAETAVIRHLVKALADAMTRAHRRSPTDRLIHRQRDAGPDRRVARWSRSPAPGPTA